MKKSNKVESEKIGFYVDHDAYTEVTSEADPESDYSGDDTYTDHQINKIIPSLGSEKRFNVVGGFSKEELEQASKVYLVYLIYSTGDSFSRSERKNIEFIQVFLSEEKAKRCVKQIKSQNGLYSELNRYKPDIVKAQELAKDVMDFKHSFKKDKGINHDFFHVCFQDEKDEVQRIYADWNGYFESLDEIDIKEFNLKPSLKMKI